MCILLSIIGHTINKAHHLRYDGNPRLDYYYPEDLGLCHDDFSFKSGRFLLRGSRLRVAGSLLYTDSRGANLSATFFLAGPCPLTMSPDVSFPADMLMADQHAPEGLVQHQQEMLTPDLILAVRSGWICPRKKRQFPEP